MAIPAGGGGAETGSGRTVAEFGFAHLLDLLALGAGQRGVDDLRACQPRAFCLVVKAQPHHRWHQPTWLTCPLNHPADRVPALGL